MKKDKKKKKRKSSKKTKKDKKSITSKKGSKTKRDKRAEKSKEVEVITGSENFDFEGFHEFDNGKRLTFIERLKLIRNSIVLLIAIVAIFVFLKGSIVVSEEIDLIVIFSSILFTLFAFLLFVYFIKHILDLKNGSVETFKGTINKESEEALYTSQLPICTITLDLRIHHVGINHYLKIKDNDFVVLRRAPITRCIVGLKINPNEE
jgi:ABC-type multidrug transport system fused ATPase/permease subunit